MNMKVSIPVFSDAGRREDHGQLSYVAGLLIGDISKDSIFHTLSWSSRKSKRPVKSIGAAETLAAGEAIDEGKILARVYSKLFGMQVKLSVALDTKDLYNSFSTQRNSIDKSIRSDVNVIRYEFETKNVNNIYWIPGKLNLADPGTKADSPLTQALQLLLHNGKLPYSFDGLESRSTNRSLG